MVKELEKAERALLATGDPRDQRFAGIIAVMRRVRGGDIKDTIYPKDVQKAEVQDVNPLARIIEAYQNQPHTPELVTQTHQAIWQARGELVGATYEVIPCDYTQEQLADLAANGMRAGYLPAELATTGKRYKLGEMFPKMQSHSVREFSSVNPVMDNVGNSSGWFDYEVAISAPHYNVYTERGEFMESLKKDRRRMLTLNEYIVAGQDSKLFTGQYLDETATWVRLGFCYAYFYPGGYLRVDQKVPMHRTDTWEYPAYGRRSSSTFYEDTQIEAIV